MSDQVKELIEEMIPNIREEIMRELKPQYEAQYLEQLNQVKQEIQGSQFMNNQLAEKRRELAQQIMNQIEQEFEYEKQSLIHNVSVSLSKSRSMQVLEQQQKILKEYSGYVEEEVRKKTHLIKLNCQKIYDEERLEIKNEMTNEFTEKLQIHLEQLEQTKSQLTVDYQNQREKLLKIEAETKQFQYQKENQENIYGQQIQDINEQVKLLQDQLSQIKALKHQPAKLKPQKKESIPQQQNDTSSQLSPYQSAIKNKILQDCLVYEGLNIVNFDELPDLFHLEIKQINFEQKQSPQNLIPQYESNNIQKSDIGQTINTQMNTHDSQIVSFNVSQPSVVKNTINQIQTHNNSSVAQQKQQFSQHQQIQKQSQIYQEKENDPSIQGNINYPRRSSQSPNLQKSSQDDYTKKSTSINQSTIVEKLENLCKEKIKQSQTSFNQRQTKVQLPQDNFEELFQIDSKDNQTTKNIKMLRLELQTKFLEDIQLEDNYFQQITYFRLNFVQQFPKNQQSCVAQQIQELISIWNKGHLSFQERIDYIKRIINNSNSTQQLEQILDECQNYYQQNEILIDKLQQRQSFRSQIIKENYLCQKNKKIFSALKSLTHEIKGLLQYKFFWREVDVDQIIMIDQFEQQLIEREEMKEEIKKKVEKKFK